jgi:hypothetical protein
MICQQPFYFGRIAVETAQNEHVFQAVGNFQVAIGV